jgi:hypothetical protein
MNVSGMSATLIDHVAGGLQELQRFKLVENGVRVSTHCLYPSNDVVNVTIYGTGSSYIVTDSGRAISEAERAGARVDKPESYAKAKQIKSQGLLMENGAIRSPVVPLEAVPAAIMLVANASKEVADHIFSTYKIAKKRDFRQMLKELVRSRFSGFDVREDEIIGKSNKAHHFENIIRLPEGDQIIVDAVLRDANSINARCMANIDVLAAHHHRLTQRIVFDDAEDWPASDLNLLGVSGIPAVAFSRSEMALGELVRH